MSFEYSEIQFADIFKWIESTKDKVEIINNAKDFEKYIECIESIPNIDFSFMNLKYSSFLSRFVQKTIENYL